MYYFASLCSCMIMILKNLNIHVHVRVESSESLLISKVYFETFCGRKQRLSYSPGHIPKLEAVVLIEPTCYAEKISCRNETNTTCVVAGVSIVVDRTSPCVCD